MHVAATLTTRWPPKSPCGVSASVPRSSFVLSLNQVRDCKQPLTPKELMMVTGGPKTIDFGVISVYTTATRNFTVMNELRTSVLVALNTHDCEEIAQTAPLSQVNAEPIVYLMVKLSIAGAIRWRRSILFRDYFLELCSAFQIVQTSGLLPTQPD
eukprot:6203594-Pleurochrysis_carterae.AAC.1